MIVYYFTINGTHMSSGGDRKRRRIRRWVTHVFLMGQLLFDHSLLAVLQPFFLVCWVCTSRLFRGRRRKRRRRREAYCMSEDFFSEVFRFFIVNSKPPPKREIERERTTLGFAFLCVWIRKLCKRTVRCYCFLCVFDLIWYDRWTICEYRRECVSEKNEKSFKKRTLSVPLCVCVCDCFSMPSHTHTHTHTQQQLVEQR